MPSLILNIPAKTALEKVLDRVANIARGKDLPPSGFPSLSIKYLKGDHSSVGLERCRDMAEVAGSNPAGPTIFL